MNLLPQTAQNELDVARLIKIALGILLMLCGLYTVFEVLALIRQCINDGASFGIMKSFVNVPPEARTITTPQATIELPAMAFLGTGYFLLVLFLTAAGSLAGTLLRGGIQLIQDDPARALERLRKALVDSRQTGL